MRDDDCIIHPRRGTKEREIPSSGIFCVNNSEAKMALEAVAERGGERRFLHNSGLAVSAAASRFVAGPALGAPAAVLVLEKLIVLGARSIVLLGWCGAVDNSLCIGDILIPSGSISGEGTSAYYPGNGSGPVSSVLTSRLLSLFEGDERVLHRGVVWSTDAPYRESRSHLEKLRRKKQVVAVDMEFSALCSVARFRGVEFAGIMIVSDELWGESWRPGFKDQEFRETCRNVLDRLLDHEV